MKTVAVVQARTGSTRLPSKVLADIEGQPMLARVVGRLSRARRLDEIVVATTTGAGDDPVVKLCEERGIAVVRGSEDDVLDRFRDAMLAHEADIVVRVCADCPLVDPILVDQAVDALLDDAELDYVSLSMPVRSFPLGLDVEAIRSRALTRAWEEDKRPDWREHVTPYIYRTPGAFQLRGLRNAEDLSWMRLTVDTPGDLALVRKLYQAFGRDDMSWQEVVEMLRAHPEWRRLNEDVRQKTVG